MSEAGPGAGPDPGVGAILGMSSGSPGRTEAGSRFALTGVEHERLASNLRKAVKRARRSGEQTLASISLALPAEVDPMEVACASRRAGEPWFVFEQPDHGSASLAGLGEAIGLQASGPERFERVTRRWRALSAAARGRRRDRGGWLLVRAGWRRLAALAGLRAGLTVVPEVTLARRERRCPPDAHGAGLTGRSPGGAAGKPAGACG